MVGTFSRLVEHIPRLDFFWGQSLPLAGLSTTEDAFIKQLGPRLGMGSVGIHVRIIELAVLVVDNKSSRAFSCCWNSCCRALGAASSSWCQHQRRRSHRSGSPIANSMRSMWEKRRSGNHHVLRNITHWTTPCRIHPAISDIGYPQASQMEPGKARIALHHRRCQCSHI